MIAALEDAAPYTKSPPARLAAMASAIQSVETNNILGDIVECGVWRGGNIILARKLAPSRQCWLYDTFAGMPKPGAFDMTRSGTPAMSRYAFKQSIGTAWDAATLDDVRANFAATDTLDDSKVRFVMGPVESTLLEPANLPSRIAVLRLDTDFYSSTKIELEILYPLLASGGTLIVDDYGHWMGARRAVHEYFGAKLPKFTSIDYTAISLVKS